MAKANCFEEPEIWQLSSKLCFSIFEEFGKIKDFYYRDQILGCSLSIMNNIAEGFERNSNKEFVRFLKISKGSCGELRSMLYLAEDFGYTEKSKAESFRSDAQIILKKTGALISAISSSTRNP
ncbi:MAG: four helix bundle protein [Bacteroidota bacterium]